MGIKTGAEYIESLRKLRPTVYIEGEKIDCSSSNDAVVDHPLVRPSLETIAMVYDMANKTEYADIMTTTSHLTGERISTFTHIAQNQDDLERKVRALRLLQHFSGGVCVQRCATLDGMASPYSITYEIDEKYGTEYHKRFKEFVKKVQKDDLSINLGVTDPKGNRKLRPHEQKNPFAYLKIIEQNKEGIVVKGAKLHQTGGLGCHVRLITPTRALTEEDKDYAVMFSVPADAEGVISVLGQMAPVSTGIEENSIETNHRKYSSHTTWMFFDDVFVPWENVYMCGEYEFAAPLISRFGNYHRTTYGGCFPGWGDVMVGVSSMLGDIHGLSSNHIIKDKITEMVYLTEVMYCCGTTAAHLGVITPSGVCIPDSVAANTLKINYSRAPYEIARLAEDVAGGIMLTLPTEKDLGNPDIKKWMELSLEEEEDIPYEDRFRLVSFLTDTLHRDVNIRIS